MKIAYWVAPYKGVMELVSESRLLFRVYKYRVRSAGYVGYGYNEFFDAFSIGKNFDNLDEAMVYGTAVITSGGYRVLTEREMNLL